MLILILLILILLYIGENKNKEDIGLEPAEYVMTCTLVSFAINDMVPKNAVKQ